MKLMIGGARPGGAGYPNADNTIRILEHAGVEIIERGQWLPESLHLWKLAKAPPWRAVTGLLRLAALNLISLAKVLHAQRNQRMPVYVPYPTLFFLWFASWLPAQLRPVCIADAYISIWDSMFQDRSSAKKAGILSNWIKAAEARSLRAAAMVLVDTVANKSYMAEQFGIPPSRLRAFPLAIAEAPFVAARRRNRSSTSPLVILFIGTMIPLHGVDVLLAGIEPLLANDRYLFRLVGDGQSAHFIEAFLADHAEANIEWIRPWQSLEQVAAHIQQADVCLGVFGGNGKATRVLPFKAYMYLAAGRVLVSQSGLSLPDGAPLPPMATIGYSNSEELTELLVDLAEDGERRAKYETAAARYYDEWLGSSTLAKKWIQLLGTLGSS